MYIGCIGCIPMSVCLWHAKKDIIYAWIKHCWIVICKLSKPPYYLLKVNNRNMLEQSVGLHPPPPIFCKHLCFCNHLEELETVLFEIELIINNSPLTPNNLLFGRQLLYSSNTTSTVGRNLTILSSTIDKINCIHNHFLDRWRH